MKRFGRKLGLKSLTMSRKQSIYGKTVGNESVNAIFFPPQSVNDLTSRPLGLTHSPSEDRKDELQF